MSTTTPGLLKTPNGRAEIAAMFGNPANVNGTLNQAWEHANIVLVAPPNWKLYYQNSATSIMPTSGIRMHRLLTEPFNAAMSDIWDYAKQQLGAAATDDAVRDWLHKNRFDQTGGGFNFRPITAGTSLSLHAYGIAIDWDPVHNPRQKPLKNTLPDWWYAIWVKHGWSDGRHFPTPDPMHVQFATGA
jgi:hypothetical protein